MCAASKSSFKSPVSDFQLAKVERPVPAAAVASAQGALLIAGPRGVHARPLP